MVHVDGKLFGLRHPKGRQNPRPVDRAPYATERNGTWRSRSRRKLGRTLQVLSPPLRRGNVWLLYVIIRRVCTHARRWLPPS